MTTLKQKEAEVKFKPSNKILTGQKASIVNFIELMGSITPFQAYDYCNCTKLATRIGEIERRCGWVFNRVKESNGSTHWVRYSFCKGVDPSVYRIPSSEKIAQILKKYSAVKS